jgi:hypothetical protein
VSRGADKQTELADFARFLLARHDDDAWERRIAYPQARVRLDAFLRDSAAEGDEPLDLNRLGSHPLDPPNYLAVYLSKKLTISRTSKTNISQPYAMIAGQQ